MIPDQQIITLIRTNKTDKALAALYRYFPMVYKLIRSKGGSKQDAEDIFQEALMVLCRKVTTTDFHLTAQLSTYLFSVCRFLWKDELKKRKHYSIADFDTGLSLVEEEDLHTTVEDEGRAKLAEKVLMDLGERCRELLLLFYQSGMALKEIARRMGYSSENTAKNQKYKCLEGAKNKLKELKQTTQTF
jgi:RNA polymerase sigma factor (sigma-70 family)